jgi:DNA-binding transcriptional MerR regulator
MEYRVEELAAAAGVRIDTIRFYQTRGLLPRPRRERRLAVYSDEHLRALTRIRRYQSQGFNLAAIKKMLADEERSAAGALLSAAADESGERTLTRAELALESGVPEPFLVSLESTGLLPHPRSGDGEPLYGEADLQMARAGLLLLKQGFPLDELLQLAREHARHIEDVSDRAIELFDQHVRKVDREGADPRAVADTFRALLPAVTTLVAVHFQRTLLARAIDRLREVDSQEDLRAAVAAVESGRLEVSWK